MIEQLHRDDQLTVRIAYNLFTQNKGKEVDDFRGWSEYCSRARAMTCCATTALAKCWCSPRPTSSCSTSRALNCRLSWNRNCTMW